MRVDELRDCRRRRRHTAVDHPRCVQDGARVGSGPPPVSAPVLTMSPCEMSSLSSEGRYFSTHGRNPVVSRAPDDDDDDAAVPAPPTADDADVALLPNTRSSSLSSADMVARCIERVVSTRTKSVSRPRHWRERVRHCCWCTAARGHPQQLQQQPNNHWFTAATSQRRQTPTPRRCRLMSSGHASCGRRKNPAGSQRAAPASPAPGPAA